jgi:hypothetical protein
MLYFAAAWVPPVPQTIIYPLSYRENLPVEYVITILVFPPYHRGSPYLAGVILNSKKPLPFCSPSFSRMRHRVWIFYHGELRLADEEF